MCSTVITRLGGAGSKQSCKKDYAERIDSCGEFHEMMFRTGSRKIMPCFKNKS